MTYNGPTRLTLELLSLHQNFVPLLIDVPLIPNVPLVINVAPLLFIAALLMFLSLSMFLSNYNCPDIMQCSKCSGSVVAVRESCDDDHLHVMCVVTRQAPRAVRGYLRPAEVLLLLC